MVTIDLIWVRGAGELASAVAHLLFRLGYPVIMSEIDPPLAIRRPVTFSDAICEGQTVVENVTATFYQDIARPEFPLDHIPLFCDDTSQFRQLSPDVIVDCRMLKQELADMRDWAKLIIGLGPGFHVEKNVHAVIETKRGHDLGRVICAGSAMADTGVPGVIGGESIHRLVRSPEDGRIKWQVNFGDLVEPNQVLGLLNSDIKVTAPTGGVVRGLISEATPVFSGMKIGDVDPRGAEVNYLQISDKARTIAHGAMEAILLYERERLR